MHVLSIGSTLYLHFIGIDKREGVFQKPDVTIANLIAACCLIMLASVCVAIVASMICISISIC